MSSVLEEKNILLQNQVKKLQTQKDTLLKELNDLEDRHEKMNQVYRKGFAMIVDTMSSEENDFSRACGNLGTALKKGESEVRIAYILEQVKTALLKEDPGSSPPRSKKGFFSLLKKEDSPSFVDDYKQGYQDIVHQLRSHLDEKYFGKLDQIAARVKNAGSIDDIVQIRETVFGLVFVFIADTQKDREKISTFVQDIVDRIFDIESRLTASYQQTDAVFLAGDRFERVLDDEMKKMKHHSDVAASLDLLKIQISERLASIENALQQKQARDRAIKEMAEKNRQSFKTGFARLKQELNEATRYSEELEKKLNQDQLTGAFNRRAYDRKIEEEMARFLRYGSVFSLLLIDADHFKQVNDNYGHAIGDRCLQEIIKRSLPLLRKNDMLARYGGEEFVVIMPETDLDGGREVAEKIRQTIENIEFIYKKDKVRVTVSIGVSQARSGDSHHQQIFERADIAVYQAKERGRNQVALN